MQLLPPPFLKFLLFLIMYMLGMYDTASNVAAGNRKNGGPLNKAMGSCCTRNILRGTDLILVCVFLEGSCSAARWQNMCA